jgi:excisionase family DNA binding protein
MPDQAHERISVPEGAARPLPAVRPDEDGLLSVDEAAELLRVSAYMIRQWARERKIPALRMGGRYWRFRRSSLNAWLADQERAAR